AGWIRQRSKDVEYGANADLAARASRVLHRRMKQRREHEANAHLLQTLSDALGVEVDVDSERFEHVGRATLAAHRAVAVLGDDRPSPGRDERRRGRDVDRIASVTAGPTGIECR